MSTGEPFDSLLELEDDVLAAVRRNRRPLILDFALIGSSTRPWSLATVMSPLRRRHDPRCHANSGRCPPDALAPLRLPPDLRLTPEQFEQVCAENREAVLELASPSDEGRRGVTALRRKMATYQANGARLGWLLLPEERAVESWPAAGAGGTSEHRIEQAEVLDGGPEFPGLRLELEEIWSA